MTMLRLRMRSVRRLRRTAGLTVSYTRDRRRDRWQLRYPVGPDAVPFLTWRASKTDEEMVEYGGATDEEYKILSKSRFGLGREHLRDKGARRGDAGHAQAAFASEIGSRSNPSCERSRSVAASRDPIPKSPVR